MNLYVDNTNGFRENGKMVTGRMKGKDGYGMKLGDWRWAQKKPLPYAGRGFVSSISIDLVL